MLPFALFVHVPFVHIFPMRLAAAIINLRRWLNGTDVCSMHEL